MRHCTRCRADAVGLLEADRTEELRGCLSACAQMPPALGREPALCGRGQPGGGPGQSASGGGRFFPDLGTGGRGFRLLEERPAPPPGGGGNRWWAMAEIFKDCRAVLVSALGETPEAILTEAGVVPVEMTGFIEVGLSRIYAGGDLSALKGRRSGVAGGCCNKKSGEGCL